jgi:exosome complex exonuclease RRP6
MKNSTDMFSPLPEEMFFYARADTHYLLYIYDNLRNELVSQAGPTSPEGNPIQLVLQKSKETSLQRFERQIYDGETGKGPGGWHALLMKKPSFLTNEQLAVFCAVHAWRDEIARQDDESTAYVMTNHVLFALARLMPTDVATLYGAIHPISYNVKSRATALLTLIQSAKVAGKNGPSMADVLRSESPSGTTKLNRISKTVRERPSFLLDQGPLRSDVSVFWGTAFGSSTWDSPATINDRVGLRLGVPLPQLASDIFGTTPHSLTDQPFIKADVRSSVAVSPVASVNITGENVFTLKNGKKRKIDVATGVEKLTPEDTPMPDPPTQAHTPLNQGEGQDLYDKGARKAEKKARRKFEKAQRRLAKGYGNVSVLPDEAKEEEDFDYSKAEAVLHGASRDNNMNGQKAFNPYPKSSDAPGSMRRAQTGQNRKSHTFKS